MKSVKALLASTSSAIVLPVAWKKAPSPTLTSSPTVVLMMVQTPPSGTTRSPLMLCPVSGVVLLQVVPLLRCAAAVDDIASRAVKAKTTMTNSFLIAPPCPSFRITPAHHQRHAEVGTSERCDPTGPNHNGPARLWGADRGGKSGPPGRMTGRALLSLRAAAGAPRRGRYWGGRPRELLCQVSVASEGVAIIVFLA